MKRISHNVIENRTSKLNSYFEFPPELNLKKYTYDEQITQEDKDTLLDQKNVDYERIEVLRKKLDDLS